MENLKTHMAVPLEQWQFQHPLRDPPMQKSFRWSEIYSSAPTKALSWRTWSCSHGVSVYAIAMTDDVIYSLRDRIQVCSKTYQSVITFLHLSWQSMIYIYIYYSPLRFMRGFLDPFHWRIHGTVSWQPVLIKNWQSARGDGLPRAILGAANHVRTWPASTSRLLGSSKELLKFPFIFRIFQGLPQRYTVKGFPFCIILIYTAHFSEIGRNSSSKKTTLPQIATTTNEIPDHPGPSLHSLCWAYFDSMQQGWLHSCIASLLACAVKTKKTPWK